MRYQAHRVIVMLLCLCPFVTHAQSMDEYRQQLLSKYNNFVNKAKEDYRAYRDRVNAEYADFMRRAWTREEAQPAKPLPKRPEPPQPVVRKPSDIPQFDAIPFGEVKDLKKPDIPKPQPVVPIDELEALVITAPDNNLNDNSNDNEKPQEEARPKDEKPKDEAPKDERLKDERLKDEKPRDKKPKEQVPPVTKPREPKAAGFSFQWCRQTWNVPLEQQHRFRLKSVSESDVADAWQVLSGAKYAGVVAACLKIRDKYQLPDWGYLRFLEAMSDAFMPGQQNEARLLEMFILTQSGYRVRIARCDGRLFLLVPSTGNIYEYSYIKFGGQQYYVTDKESRSGSFYVMERDFPRAQPFVWQMDNLPSLTSEAKTRELQAQRFPDVRVTVETSRSLVSLLNDYPRCGDWDSYAQASLSKQAKEGLYPALRQYIEGKNQAEAVEILLDFVQSALDYKTDDQQFGEERPLFGDETLYYPFCDCEDRSILFSILVRELLGLKVVLLHYPEHLATAVCIGDDVKGDYVMLDGRRYVVCDPTFIGGHVGEAMPSYKKTKATIIKL